MKIETQEYNEVTVVALQGDLNVDAGEMFQDTLSQIIAGGKKSVVLDMSAIGFIDGAGLEKLLWARDYCHENNSQLKLAGLDENCEKIMEITRLDSDSALNYSINRYVKVFAGLKVVRFNWSTGSHNGLGPAAGFGLTIPVGGSFYILGNLSGAYIFGTHEGTDGGTGLLSNDYIDMGLNSNLTLAYYAQAISTTISLGFRYQYFYSDYEDNVLQSDQHHHIYGVILMAVYSFQIGE